MIPTRMIPATRRRARLRSLPRLEILEARQTPDAGVGALFGTVYFDASGLGSFAAPTPAAGATVELYRDGSAAPLATALTDARGRYVFNGLEPGSYTLVEVPPAGQTFAASRLTSQVYPASGAGSNAVHVTVVDPSSVWVNYGGVVPGEFLAMNVVVNGTPLQNAVGALAATLGTAAGKADLNAGFQTYCLDDLADLSFTGGEQFRVKPRAITDLIDGNGAAVSADRAGRIAYLYNTYSQASLSNVDSAGLQLALWELMYDSGPTADFTQGDFQVVSAVSPADQALVDQAVSRATVLFNLSADHDGGALLLDARAFNQTGSRPSASSQ
ncbi:MAG: SdrD B-like domain-containing protein [Isosphaeraceae bacterium]